MANNDWNPDDLLDFHFDREVRGQDDGFEVFDELKRSNEAAKPAAPERRQGLDDSFDSYDEMKRYEELRRQSRQRDQHPEASPKRRPQEVNASAAGSAGASSKPAAADSSGKKRERAHRYDFTIQAPLSARGASRMAQPPASDESVFEQYDRNHAAGRSDRAPVVEPDEPHAFHSDKEIAAIKQASQEAIDRYRSNYTKNKKKREAAAPARKFHKVLTIIYVATMAAFLISVLIMNVLPAKFMIALCVILGLLSLIILFQTRRRSIKKWGRRLATLLAVVLIGLYGLGTAYALSTMSFLSSTSVDNPDAVPIITRDPFNVVITGMDVKGKIDKEGRSDVNMILTVNPATAQVLMTSIPRDYQIYMPDKDNAVDKLTHTGFYSVQTTILAEEDLLDMNANYYVKVNFTTVEKFIDAIGGVDVYSEYEFNPVKMKDWTVKEGMNHMNGKQALAFARERKAFPTGDNQRIKNQQAVFEAMFKKATSSRTMIFSYNKILNDLKDYFEMSFSSREIRTLAKMQLARFPDWQIYKNTVAGGDGLMPTYTTGGEYCYVMTQDEESIGNAKTLINAVLEGKALMKDDDGVVSVAPESL